jgi:5-methylcytosine-specific restriction endonuclease McrA
MSAPKKRKRTRRSTIPREELVILLARLERLGYVSYASYLRSPRWFRNRARLIGQRCERCDATRRLQLHHKTYASLGEELKRHVETMCDDCHRKEHGLRPRRRRRM